MSDVERLPIEDPPAETAGAAAPEPEEAPQPIAAAVRLADAGMRTYLNSLSDHEDMMRGDDDR